MVLITVVAAGILISKRICRMRRQRQTAAQERLEAEKTIQMGMGWGNWPWNQLGFTGKWKCEAAGTGSTCRGESPESKEWIRCTPSHGPTPRTRNFRTDDGRRARNRRKDRPVGLGKRNRAFDPRRIWWRRTRRAKWPGFRLVSWKRRWWSIWR